MPVDLLLAALEKAESSVPAVRAAALMHIARVWARADQAAAVEQLERGIALAREVDSNDILANAVYLAAAVSPKHALPLHAETRRPDYFGGAVVGLVNAMVEHGHVDDALAYLCDPLPKDRLPLRFLGNIEWACRDDGRLLKLLRAAIRRWREHPPEGTGHDMFEGCSFVGYFARHWNLLPRDEAAEVCREMVAWTFRAPPANNVFPDGPQLTTGVERQLYVLSPPLQGLDPELTATLFARYPQLADAVKRSPVEPRPRPARRVKLDASDDVMTIGDAGLMPMDEALATDFKAGFREAYELYAKDSDTEDPNSAPKECWPSAREYRNILFKAGQHQGVAAEKHLARIPDLDLRLFAQIELCAAVEGLPQIGGGTVWRPSKPRQRRMPSAAELDRVFGPGLQGIRCPRCQWTPRAKIHWSCKCGHRWNTFESRGLCPGCRYQWETTGCPQCGETSPHTDWYVPQ